MLPLTKDTPVYPGMKVFTMNMGKVVPIRVLWKSGHGCQDDYGDEMVMGVEYFVEYVGDAPVCLDVGNKWYLYPGDRFHTRKGNMDRALEWMAEKY